MKNLKKVLATITAVFMMLLCVGSANVFANTTGSTVTGDTFTYEGSDKTEDGSIKIKNATKDTTYTLYKIFDATYSGTNVSYTIKAGNLKAELSKDEWKDYFTIGATADGNGNYSVTRAGTTTNGVFTATKTDAELIRMLKTLETDLFTEIGSIKSTVNGAIEWKNVPYGYYLISPDKPTEGTPVVTIDSNVPTAEVIDKNQTNSFNKSIVTTTNNTETLVKANEAGLKEDVPFRITVNATNYDSTDKVFKYVITDTLDTGMTYKQLPPTIKVDGVDPTTTVSYKYYDESDGEVTTVNEATLATIQKFEATINWTQDGTKASTHAYASNATITVDYTAYLDPTKKDDLKIGGGTDANTNTAEVKYFKGPENTPDETNPEGDLGQDKTYTFTTKLTIQKVDDDSNALQGAEFTLTGPEGAVVITTKDVFTESDDGTYYLLKDGTYTTTKPGSEIDGQVVSSDNYVSTTVTYVKETKTEVTGGTGNTQTAIKAEVGTDGKVSFTGLGAGTYTLVETKVPSGFNKIDDITFTIGFDATKTSEGVYNGTFSVTNISPETMSIQPDSESNLYTTVVNNKGSKLPSTGGMGTTLLYVVGGLLVVGAAIFFVTNKRMQKN